MIEPSKVKEEFNKVEDENYAFRAYLKNHADISKLDEQFLELHNELFVNYDCSKCRNCCKEYSASFEKHELVLVADFLKIQEKEFIDKYVEEDFGEYQIKKKYISIGIDVCKGKWVAVALTEKGFEVNKFNNIEEICNKYEEADSIIVDIPIGLPENINNIRPEVEARKHLKGKSSSIFNVQCRQAVYLIDYESANEKNREILGKGLAKQSFGIASKIKEVDDFLNNNPKWKNKLQEGHPEICFSKLNNGEAVIENKTKLEGQQIRLDILKKYYSESHLVIAKYLKDVPARKKIDDVIDALCLAVMGVIGLENGFETIPKAPMEDGRGIKMQMVYGKVKEDNKIKYDKLVRDKIPEVIKATGKECEFEIAPKEERYRLLEAKLNEELYL